MEEVGKKGEQGQPRVWVWVWEDHSRGDNYAAAVPPPLPNSSQLHVPIPSQASAYVVPARGTQTLPAVQTALVVLLKLHPHPSFLYKCLGL